MSHNLFFALWPDDDVRARIASAARQLKKAHAPRGRWIEPHRYHLTLRYLGAHATVPDALLAAAQRQLPAHEVTGWLVQHDAPGMADVLYVIERGHNE